MVVSPFDDNLSFALCRWFVACVEYRSPECLPHLAYSLFGFIIHLAFFRISYALSLQKFS